MIAIPNMEKPKSCWECPLYDSEYPWTCDLFDAYCPLIEIVPCSECKHSKIYALQSDAPMKRWCHNGRFPKEVTDDYYCGDGERRKTMVDINGCEYEYAMLESPYEGENKEDLKRQVDLFLKRAATERRSDV